MRTEAERRELRKGIRQNVLNVLELLSSFDKQLTYQRNVPVADVSAELFCQWDDHYQSIRTDSEFVAAFSQAELGILDEFNVDFDAILSRIAKTLPPIEEFSKTAEWKELADAASQTMKKLQEP